MPFVVPQQPQQQGGRGMQEPGRQMQQPGFAARPQPQLGRGPMDIWGMGMGRYFGAGAGAPRSSTEDPRAQQYPQSQQPPMPQHPGATDATGAMGAPSGASLVASNGAPQGSGAFTGPGFAPPPAMTPSYGASLVASNGGPQGSGAFTGPGFQPPQDSFGAGISDGAPGGQQNMMAATGPGMNRPPDNPADDWRARLGVPMPPSRMPMSPFGPGRGVNNPGRGGGFNPMRVLQSMQLRGRGGY